MGIGIRWAVVITSVTSIVLLGRSPWLGLDRITFYAYLASRIFGHVCGYYLTRERTDSDTNSAARGAQAPLLTADADRDIPVPNSELTAAMEEASDNDQQDAYFLNQFR